MNFSDTLCLDWQYKVFESRFSDFEAESKPKVLAVHYKQYVIYFKAVSILFKKKFMVGNSVVLIVLALQKSGCDYVHGSLNKSIHSSFQIGSLPSQLLEIENYVFSLYLVSKTHSLNQSTWYLHTISF